jgi:hypothetical protein
MLINQSNTLNFASLRTLCTYPTFFRALLRTGGTRTTITLNMQHLLDFRTSATMPNLLDLLTDAQVAIGFEMKSVKSKLFTRTSDITFEQISKACQHLDQPLMGHLVKLHRIAFLACTNRILSKSCYNNDHESLHILAKACANENRLPAFRGAMLHHVATVPDYLLRGLLTSGNSSHALEGSPQDIACNVMELTLHQFRLSMQIPAVILHDYIYVHCFDAVCAIILLRSCDGDYKLLKNVSDICCMVQLSVITCDHKSATLEACSQSIHLAGWLMQTRSRCAAILNHEHRDNSAILKNFKRGVLVWLKQNTVHGILRKFQIHKMTLRALGTPCIKTTLGQLLAETLFDGAMFDMPSHNLLSKNCKSMLLSDGITQEQVCVILE